MRKGDAAAIPMVIDVSLDEFGQVDSTELRLAQNDVTPAKHGELG